MRIDVVAPGARIEPALAETVTALASARFGDAVSLAFHPQCFAASGHFAGDDEARANAFLEAANGPADAVWFAAGGYGACRILPYVLGALDAEARAKTYLGYSDAGVMLSALHEEGCNRVAHGPMVSDMRRTNGAEAIGRALDYLVRNDRSTLEPRMITGDAFAAFNLTILQSLMGTPYEPTLADKILMIEEVGEHHYRIDRMMFHLSSQPVFSSVAGLMLGRCDPIPENDRPFGATEEEIVQYWCHAAGVPYLGRCDIGHDVANKIVPFGVFA